MNVDMILPILDFSSFASELWGDHTKTLLQTGLKLCGLLLLAWFSNWLGKNIILRSVHYILRRSKARFGEYLLNTGVLTRLSHIVPAMVVHVGAPLLFQEKLMVNVLHTIVAIYLVIIVLLIIDATLNLLHLLIAKSVKGKDIPVKGFIQAGKLIFNIIGLIFIVSIIFGKTPVFILSGLGALTAVLMLIFRDAILGFVAGIQLSVNKMVRPGDWIEMESNNANGDVLDVSLTTVKVQNFDRTITSIPAYDLISKSFINWRGMAESGGRRIKRAIRIDIRTIRFVDDELLEKLQRIQLLKPYLAARISEIKKWNESRHVDESELVNGRHLTNVGCFRAYCRAYLENDSRIRKDMTFIFRQLAPDGNGLPLEIYVFTNTTNWDEYETIQADIFDHFMASLPRFELAAYQQPSGRDLEELRPGQELLRVNK